MIPFGPDDHPSPRVALTLRPGGGGALLVVGLCDPGTPSSPSPADDDFQPLFELGIAAPAGTPAGALAWEQDGCAATDGEEEEWAVGWREAATGATVRGRAGRGGAPLLELRLAAAECWWYRGVGCSPLAGPSERRPRAPRRDAVAAAEGGASPFVGEALRAAGGFHAQLPLRLACDAFTLHVEAAPGPGGPGTGELWLESAAAGEGSGAPPFECGWRPAPRRAAAAGNGLYLHLLLNFHAAAGPVAWPRSARRPGSGGASTGAARTAHRGLDLPSLGIAWIAPRGTPAPAVLEWADRLGLTPWPGGVVEVDEEVLAALDPAAIERLRAAGLVPRRRAGSDEEGASADADAQLATLALDGLRPDPARAGAFLRRTTGASLEDTLAVLALAPFVPRARVAIDPAPDGGGALLPAGHGLTGATAEAWKRAAAYRGAFLPYLAHLRVRELVEGRPALHPVGLSPHDWPNAGMMQGPGAMLGDDVFVAGLRAGGARSLFLPGGEWVDFFEGSRFRDVRQVPESRLPPPPGRVVAMVRSGAVLPLFDLGIRAPFATRSARRPGPPDRLVLKLAPQGEREQSFYDPFAVAGDALEVPLGAIPRLRVAYRRDRHRLLIDVAGRPRRLTLLLRWHRPSRIAAGPSAREAAPLAQAENERQFAVAEDCWLHHAQRDEVMVKTRVEPDAPLHVVVEDLE